MVEMYVKKKILMKKSMGAGRKKKGEKKVYKPGNDPGTLHVISEHSTI